MAIPDGYVALDFVGFTDQGTYDSTATYMTNDLVHDTYNNIWKCLQDNTSNVAPAAGDYWSLFMGASDSLTAMTATDTSGVLGSAGQIVVAQSLVDAIANKVMNELVYKIQIINNLLATVAGNALDAVQGKELNDKIVSLNSDLTATKAAYVAADSNLQGQITALSTPKTLWSGTGYMRADQTITLSEKVSAQKSGIVLCWEGYDTTTGTATNARHNYFFVPKSHIDRAGAGVSMLLSAPANIAEKYVYIKDDQIAGYETNVGDRTVNGITMTPSSFVLTRVLGV